MFECLCPSIAGLVDTLDKTFYTWCTLWNYQDCKTGFKDCLKDITVIMFTMVIKKTNLVVVTLVKVAKGSVLSLTWRRSNNMSSFKPLSLMQVKLSLNIGYFSIYACPILGSSTY
jgi:hypothetical protein